MPVISAAATLYKLLAAAVMKVEIFHFNHQQGKKKTENNPSSN
jgi:hypothetical protein